MLLFRLMRVHRNIGPLITDFAACVLIRLDCTGAYAIDRGLWDADDETPERLKRCFLSIEEYIRDISDRRGAIIAGCTL